ncbi:MAG: hypothetical protein LBR80_07420 [Deltaproteobacteria bacterium]|nr:hypothetical protein [Deltaproteobacteria bacterium]
MELFWRTYSAEEPWSLVAASHAEGSPWQQVATPAKDKTYYDNPIIPIEVMKAYFLDWRKRENLNG